MLRRTTLKRNDVERIQKRFKYNFVLKFLNTTTFQKNTRNIELEAKQIYEFGFVLEAKLNCSEAKQIQKKPK